MTEKQKQFHERNKYRTRIGKCTICGKDAPWNEEKGRYDRFCSAKCVQEYVAIRNKRMLDKYGTTNLAADPNFQKEKLMPNRSIAKVYEFKDGSTRTVLSMVEYSILEELEKLGYDSMDIDAPAKMLINYDLGGKTMIHIPDIYIKSLNLIISAKDGMANPNMHPNFQKDRKKNICIFKSILDNYTYNYIQVEGVEEVKALKNTLETVSKLITRNNRVVIPPRIDFILYHENVGRLGQVGTFKYALVGFEADDSYINTYLTYDFMSDNALIYREENDVSYMIPVKIDVLRERCPLLVVVDVSRLMLSIHKLRRSEESSTILKILDIANIEYNGSSFDSILASFFNEYNAVDINVIEERIDSLDMEVE